MDDDTPIFGIAVLCVVLLVVGCLLVGLRGDTFPTGTQVVVTLTDGHEVPLGKAYGRDYSPFFGSIKFSTEKGFYTYPLSALRGYQVILPRDEGGG